MIHVPENCSKESREGMLEEDSLEASSENRHRGCRRDMLRQTVPSTGSGNSEGPITDGGQYTITDKECIFTQHTVVYRNS